MTGSLPQNAAARKASPMAEGLLWYFPNALAAVAAVSKAGNDQHNPGGPMHHARGKSMDHADCIMRHLVDAGTIDTDGQRHSAKVAWRALALLQEEIEREDGVPLPRNARLTPNADTPAKSPHDDFTIAQDPPDLPMGWLARGGIPAESSCIASFVPKWSPQWLADQGVPPDSRKIARFHKDGSRIATEAEVASLREHLTAEQLREYGIGDVEPRHPMHAETLRDEYERTDGGTGL